MIIRRDKNNSKEITKEKIIKPKKDKNELILAKNNDLNNDIKNKVVIDPLKKNEKNKSKNIKDVDYSNEKKHKSKRLFFGLGKEFWRITWPTNKKMLNDFVTTIIVMTFFVLIFTGIGFLIGTFVK